MSPKQLRKKEKESEAPEGRDEMNSAEADEIQGTTKSVRTKASKKSIKSKKSVKSIEEGLLSKVSSRSNEGSALQEVGESESIDMSTMVSTDESTLMDEPCFTKSASEAEDVTIATSAEEKDDTYTIRTNGRKEKKTVMNKDVIIHAPGGPENLVVRKMYYVPAAKDPEDVIIQVEASTVTVRDCLLCQGLGTDKAVFPFTPGCEIVGVITDLGGSAKLEGWRVGDRVIAFDHVKGGGNAKSVKVNMKCIAMISTTIDAASAACLADVYMSAYKAIRLGKKDGLPLTGKKVLVTDGFSPIGQAIVALAKLEGANIYVTTSNSKELEYMTKLGVKCFPFSPHKWLHKVVGKMDIVIDNTCIDSYESSWEAVSPDGMLVCTTGMTSIHNFKSDEYGESAGCANTIGLDMPKFRSKWAAMKAKYLMSNTTFLDLKESAANDRKAYQQELKYLCFLVESGALVPKIAERVQIEEVADAHRYLETGKANGTIVCIPSRDKN
jgi:NADPH:quinone reductase-like Zn-dependent oxidoreductase